MIAMSIVAPMAAMLIQMAISRSREFLADATGARIAGNAEGLARALEKLEGCAARRKLAATPSTAHLFTVSPVAGGRIGNLFSTHPSIEDRVARLRGDWTKPGGPRESFQGSSLDAGRSFWDNLNR